MVGTARGRLCPPDVFTGITDTILRFSPVLANAEDLKRFHGTNERLSFEGYADMIRIYRRLIENTAG